MNKLRTQIAVKNGKGNGRSKTLKTHCKRGHEFTEENTRINAAGARVCRTCVNESSKEANRKKREEDPEGFAQRARESRKQWRENNPEYHFEYALKRDYNLTPEEYQAIWDEQEGRCAVCRKELSVPAHIDHDHNCCDYHHKTCGKCIRGILCPLCNQGLGQFKDNEENLRRATDYIRFHRERRETEDAIEGSPENGQ